MMTAPQNHFDAISPTALLVTYARQFSDIPFTTELAQSIDIPTVLEQFAIDSQEDILLLAALFEARYKAVDWAIAQSESKQIVELASGLLPRGMVMSQNPEMTFVESDLPAMIHFKQLLVAQIIGEPPNLHFHAIDAASQPSQLPVGMDYLRESEPVTLVCEGLLQYLTMSEKRQLFANIREMLKHYGGVWITPDLATKQSQLQIEEHSTPSQRLHQSIIKTTGRSLVDNGFNDRVEIKQFISEQGFQVEECSLLDVVDRLTCLEILGSDSENFDSVLGTRYISMLTLSHV
jgi:O-methyltransferase involved in polyketide biosynthesis